MLSHTILACRLTLHGCRDNKVEAGPNNVWYHKQVYSPYTVLTIHCTHHTCTHHTLYSPYTVLTIHCTGPTNRLRSKRSLRWREVGLRRSWALSKRSKGVALVAVLHAMTTGGQRTTEEGSDSAGEGKPKSRPTSKWKQTGNKAKASQPPGLHRSGILN
jgi:hypothetical protein